MGAASCDGQKGDGKACKPEPKANMRNATPLSKWSTTEKKPNTTNLGKKVAFYLSQKPTRINTKFLQVIVIVLLNPVIRKLKK